MVMRCAFVLMHWQAAVTPSVCQLYETSAPFEAL
jgi:hypothetical protein